MVKYRFPKRVFVGIDYHQSAVQVCVLDREGEVLANRVCENDWRKVVEVASRFEASQVEVAIEACTGSANLAEELVQRAGWSVSLAHPGYVARLKGSPDKTDFGDARLLADLIRVGYLPKVWLAPESIRELRRLVRYRHDLSKQQRGMKLKVSAVLRELRVTGPSARRWTIAWRRWLAEVELPEQSRWVLDRYLAEVDRLKGHLKEVDERLQQLTREDPVVVKLLQLSGIGLVTAVTLRAEIGRFDRFRTGKQFARFCGLTPKNASSGDKQADAGLIRAGNPELRRVIIQASHRIMHLDDHWVAFAERLKRKGKPHCVIVAAVANRWLRWVFHQMQGMPAELAA